MVSSLNAIAAVSQNMGIGKNGTLPWPPLRNEFKYFQRMTTTPSVPGQSQKEHTTLPEAWMML